MTLGEDGVEDVGILLFSAGQDLESLTSDSDTDGIVSVVPRDVIAALLVSEAIYILQFVMRDF